MTSSVSDKGYIYVRTHEYYDKYNACRIGKTNNIYETDKEQSSREIERGKIDLVFEFPIKRLNIIENLLIYQFCDLHIQKNGGNEFYNKKIINLIEPYFVEKNIPYKKLSIEEINTLLKV